MRERFIKMSKEEVTTKIIGCAKDSFLHNGYHGTSLKTICKQAGVTTGALYHRFPGKDALYRAVVEPATKKLLETLNNCPTNAACSIMPEQGLILVYLYWDVFRIVVRCRCTSYYNEFYSAIEKSVYHRLSKLNNNYAEDICWLLSRAYLASFFEIICCDYDFETAQKCIGILENFFASQEIHC